MTAFLARSVNSPAFASERALPKSLALALTVLFVALAQAQVSLSPADPPAAPASPLATAAPAKLGTGALASNKPPAVLLAPKSEAKPTWADLTPDQQKSLQPLTANWVGMGEAQKRKWLAVSKNYSQLSPPEQSKLHSRMTSWAALSPQQRTQARLNFAEAKKLAPAEKSAQWEAYQALSPQEKQKLAAQSSGKPVGASTPLKPVAPQKLASVPITRQAQKPGGEPAPQRAASATAAVDQHTLLPRLP